MSNSIYSERVETIDKEIYVNYNYDSVGKDSKGYLFTKRVIDILLSILGLIILSPLFIVVAILIKFEDPKGGVLFTQERIGEKGKKFKMYKFRSMVVDAETKLEQILINNEVSGAMFKLKDDPRVTKVGRLIRATSIDELPQLLNVIKGEMSLVGPRPPLKREVDLYEQRDFLRLMVRPGCTGLWQATVRNSVGFKEMVELDLYYIENRNIFFDIKIILMTIRSIIFSTAY